MANTYYVTCPACGYIGKRWEHKCPSAGRFVSILLREIEQDCLGESVYRDRVRYAISLMSTLAKEPTR